MEYYPAKSISSRAPKTHLAFLGLTVPFSCPPVAQMRFGLSTAQKVH
jgi:hypothetical protein